MRTLARILGWLLCRVGKHKWTYVQRLSTYAHRVSCARCGRTWAVHTALQIVLPWDGELRDFYREMGVHLRPHDE